MCVSEQGTLVPEVVGVMAVFLLLLQPPRIVVGDDHAAAGVEDSTPAAGRTRRVIIMNSWSDHAPTASDALILTADANDSHRTADANDSHHTAGANDSHRTTDANDSHRTTDANDSHRTADANDSHRTAGANGSHRTADANDSHRTADANDSHRTADDHHQAGECGAGEQEFRYTGVHTASPQSLPLVLDSCSEPPLEDLRGECHRENQEKGGDAVVDALAPAGNRKPWGVRCLPRVRWQHMAMTMGRGGHQAGIDDDQTCVLSTFAFGSDALFQTVANAAPEAVLKVLRSLNQPFWLPIEKEKEIADDAFGVPSIRGDREERVG
ncbi:hypothetical protein CYMTET_3649 [Cymbomonas tetramitiformis]|uniref:Uncharacterized protein n=1 Tax=Cymbomonas tetramitiformis TaxID=36881 RepID=A0AAE0H323_9CHLO|nr:hypothetical protein CYMTET_3649 [Cymbomonas tetramitiformis]